MLYWHVWSVQESLHKCRVAPLLARCCFTVPSNHKWQGSRGVTTVCLVYKAYASPTYTQFRTIEVAQSHWLGSDQKVHVTSDRTMNNRVWTQILWDFRCRGLSSVHCQLASQNSVHEPAIGRTKQWSWKFSEPAFFLALVKWSACHKFVPCSAGCKCLKGVSFCAATDTCS